jgi:hypothetical protein
MHVSALGGETSRGKASRPFDLDQGSPCPIVYDVIATRLLQEDKIMAMNLVPFTDMQVTAEEAIERSKEQARGVMDSYFDFLHKAVASIPTGGTQFGEKLKSYSEKNIATARDYMHKLNQAKDFREFLRIQVDFAQAQYNAFSGQAKDLSEASTKAAPDALDTRFKNVA